MPPAEHTALTVAATDQHRGTRCQQLVRGQGGQAAAMVVLTSAANIVNYGSSLVFSRVLEPVGFGELTSLLALALILAVPLGAAQTVIAERVALAKASGNDERVGYLIRHALGHVATLGIITGLAYTAAIPLVLEVLSIRHPGPAVALIPFVILTFVTPVVQGVLQGMERFAVYGLVLLALALGRVAFGVPWALAGGGAGGAIAGQALGMLVVVAGAAWRYRRLLIRRGTGAATAGLKRRLDLTALAASGTFIGFALLSNLDLVLARVYLDAESAGIYAALATIAKVVIFLPSAVAVFLVPRAARDHAKTGSGAQALRTSAALVCGAALLCIVPALLVPGQIVSAMFGPGYAAAEAGVLEAAVAGGALSMLSVVCVYSVTIRDRRWTILLMLGVALQVTTISLAHDTPEQVALMQAVVAVIVLLANEFLFHPLRPARRQT